MKRWQQLPNPLKVLDYDGDTITWTHIVDRLEELEVDFRELDGPMYEKLRACEDDDALAARLFEVKFLQTSGALAQRYLKWRDEGDAVIDRQLRDETDRMYPMSLNNRRFSHRFPMGLDINDFEAEAIELSTEGAVRRSAEDKKHQQLSRPRRWWEACKSMV